MPLKYISNHFYVAEQLSVEDLTAIQEQGIKNIICNRPDGEVPNQPAFEMIKSEAAKLGITCFYLPMKDQNVSQQLAQQTKQLLDSLEGPILAYCRTGTRSSIAWSAAQLGDMPINKIIEATTQAGYNLGDITQSMYQRL